MQLDRTHVAIRPRSLAEIGDLALLLLRQYPQAILVGFALGALPFILLNAFLIGWIPLSETAENIYDEETLEQRYRYVWLMCVLVFLETPLAGIFTTSYIGQAVFEQRPTWYAVFRDTLKLAPRLLLTLGIFRGPAFAIFLLLLVVGEPFSAVIEVVWMMVGCGFIMLIRSVRPFLPEILLLERCPLFARSTDIISLNRRSSLLHTPISGELIGRFLMVGTIISLLAVAIFYGFTFIFGTLFGSTSWSAFESMVLFPLALWTAAGFSILIRFLSYLDSRIRLEGWEVELMLRAESNRQFGTRDQRKAA